MEDSVIGKEDVLGNMRIVMQWDMEDLKIDVFRGL